MLVPVEWINDYIDLSDVGVDEFCDKMIMSGSNLETCDWFCEDVENVVVGKIEKIEPHPDADKLVICRINIGDKEAEGKDEDGMLQIVTGAPNVHVGDKIPVVLDGGRVAGNHDGKMTPGGIEIKKGKLGKALLDTTISGVAFDMLRTVDMVSDKVNWTSSGMCGKKQPMPVGMGGPALRCKVMIGGR